MGEAFTLTADYAGTITSADEDGNPVEVDKFRGASFSLGDGRTVNVGDLLEEGGGTIVTDDPEVIIHLETATYLKHVTAPEDTPPVDTLSTLTTSQLRELPEARVIEGVDTLRKADLITAIERHRAGLDPLGDDTPNVDPGAADTDNVDTGGQS